MKPMIMTMMTRSMTLLIVTCIDENHNGYNEGTDEGDDDGDGDDDEACAQLFGIT